MFLLLRKYYNNLSSSNIAINFSIHWLLKHWLWNQLEFCGVNSTRVLTELDDKLPQIDECPVIDLIIPLVINHLNSALVRKMLPDWKLGNLLQLFISFFFSAVLIDLVASMGNCSSNILYIEWVFPHWEPFSLWILYLCILGWLLFFWFLFLFLFSFTAFNIHELFIIWIVSSIRVLHCFIRSWLCTWANWNWALPGKI